MILLGTNMLFPSLKGYVGELKTRTMNSLLLNGDYHRFNNVIINTEGISTQIDHIIVSRYGIFVIETKDKSGWIYGSEKGNEWTQTFHKSKYKFQNPLHQNYRHTKTLSSFLKIPHNKIHSVIMFWGDCQFKTAMPENVIKGDATGHIRSKKDILFEDDEVMQICEALQKVKDTTPLLGGYQHVKSLKERYKSETICPKCGKALVKRTIKNGPQAGEQFLGCSGYPHCRYIKH